MHGGTTADAEQIRLGASDYVWRSGQLHDAAGQDVPLRAKSLKMFAALLSERGKVLSKDRLSELVWPDTVATDESISRCIADIRKALKDERYEIVQTYPKQGYRLNVSAVAGGGGEHFVPPWRMVGWLVAGIAAVLVAVLVALGPFGPAQIVAPPPVAELRDTVAIMPFRSEGDRFLASGLSDDLEIKLAEMSGIRAISQAQTEMVAAGATSPVELARSLKTRYIVQGRLDRSGDQIALTVQLIDGSDGATLWADRYEGRHEGLIEFRDRLPEALVQAMSIELNDRDRRRLSLRDTTSTEALEEVMLARQELSLFTYQSNLAAEKRLRHAILLDPNYARAYAELASAYVIRIENDWVVLTHADTQKAFYFAEQALELDPGLWFGHYVLGRLHSVSATGDVRAALEHLERAMELQPANDDARVYYAVVLMMSGQPAKSREIVEDVLAAHPSPPFWYYLTLANSLFHLQEYEAALDSVSNCLNQMPNSPYCLRTQIAVLARLGRIEDAEWAIEEYAILGHDTRLSAVMKTAIERNSDLLEHLRESFMLAGLK